jgi:glycosyltransferase involved in cell wall biosynthesis
MRVLLVSNFYPPYWVGGYEQIASWIAEGLRERGHEVAVLTGRGPAFDGKADVFPSLDLDLASLWETYFTTGIVPRNGLAEGVRRHVFSLRNFDAGLRAIGEFQPDLVSFWNPAFVTFAPLAAARLARVPAVVHLSDTVANVFRNPHPPAFPQGLRAVARRAVDALLHAARPARFIVPSGFLKRKFVEREGLPAARVDVLPWPVEPTVSRIEAGPRSGGTRLLFVGTLIPEKGVDILLEALRVASAERPDLALTLVGDGPQGYVARLRATTADLPVRFAGRLDRRGVVEAYGSHDILAFPSVWDEPFAVVPLEAMAMGLAVIATTAGGTPEAIVDGRTGLLVPPGDAAALARAILRLVADPALAGSLARTGQRWAREQQGFATFIERLERLYLGAAAHV